MTNEEAIKKLKDPPVSGLYAYPAFRQAVGMAIEALKGQKTGEWATRRKCEYRCSNCGKIIYADDESERRYCPCCGSMNTVNGRLYWEQDGGRA